MKTSILACFAAVAQASIVDNLFARQTAIPSDSTLPPCISVINIQGQCAPNTTNEYGYSAMAQCLCSPPSTFFADWLGCRQCLEFHGGLTGQDLSRYKIVISRASVAICTGTPIAQFADYFISIDAAVAISYAGNATVTSDQAPNQTAVSLYYTAPGPQGPGSITGSATAATRSEGATVLSGTRSSATGSATTASARTSGAVSGSAAVSTQGSDAIPTAALGYGVILAAIGGAIVL